MFLRSRNAPPIAFHRAVVTTSRSTPLKILSEDDEVCATRCLKIDRPHRVTGSRDNHEASETERFSFCEFYARLGWAFPPNCRVRLKRACQNRFAPPVPWSIRGLGDDRFMKGIILAGERVPALSGDRGRVEAAPSCLRQAHDLLSAVHPDVHRYPGHPHHHDAAGPAAVPATAGRRLRDRSALLLRPSGQPARTGGRFHRRQRPRSPRARRQHLLWQPPARDAEPSRCARAWGHDLRITPSTRRSNMA